MVPVRFAIPFRAYQPGVPEHAHSAGGVHPLRSVAYVESAVAEQARWGFFARWPLRFPLYPLLTDTGLGSRSGFVAKFT